MVGVRTVDLLVTAIDRAHDSDTRPRRSKEAEACPTSNDRVVRAIDLRRYAKAVWQACQQI